MIVSTRAVKVSYVRWTLANYEHHLSVAVLLGLMLLI